MTTPPAAEGSIRREDVTVVTALRIEAGAVRRRIPGVRVVCAGIGLRSLTDAGAVTTPVALSVGVAGGLSADHASGTVVIPSSIAASSTGPSHVTDAAWSEALTQASLRLGYPTVGGALVTSDVIVLGTARRALSDQGFVAVDMESALIAAAAGSVAAIRVILDTPVHEFTDAWMRPQRAILDPRNWPEGAALLRETRRWSQRAAGVLAEALRS